MTRMPGLRLVALVALGAAACTPTAPKELNDLTWYLYREWDNPDPKVMRAGLLNLEKILEAKQIGPDGAGADRLLRLVPLRREDITVSPYPMERDPARCLGTAVVRESPWPVLDHARIQIDPDQLPVEPSAVKYVRTFLDPTDPSCLVAGTCTRIRCSNDVTRANAVLEVSFVLTKDLRWFDLGDGRKALVGRSWTPKSGVGGGGAIWQSYTLDVFHPRPGDKTWRYQALFSENELKIATTDEIQVAVVTGGIDGAFVATDKTIKMRYHPGQ
jgi:hypothetical protein